MSGAVWRLWSPEVCHSTVFETQALPISLLYHPDSYVSPVWSKMALLHFIHITSSHTPWAARQESLFPPSKCKVGSHAHQIHSHSIGENQVTCAWLAAKKAGKCFYFGWPCVWLKIRSSINTEERENRRWGQVAVSVTQSRSLSVL